MLRQQGFLGALKVLNKGTYPNDFYQFLRLSSTKWHKGRALWNVALWCLTKGRKWSDLCLTSCRNLQYGGELNQGIQEIDNAFYSNRKNPGDFIHSSVKEWHRKPNTSSRFLKPSFSPVCIWFFQVPHLASKDLTTRRIVTDSINRSQWQSALVLLEETTEFKSKQKKKQEKIV